jgi:molybdopterin biosynthesis enzyme MoaB
MMIFQAAILTYGAKEPKEALSLVGGYITGCGFQVTDQVEVPYGDLSKTLTSLTAVSLIVVVGGTFLGPHDDSPEQLQSWSELAIPGFGELMRFETVQDGFGTYLQRGGGWLKGTTLAVAVPGSTKAALDNLKVLGPLLMMAVKGLSTRTVRASTEASTEGGNAASSEMNARVNTGS